MDPVNMKMTAIIDFFSREGKSIAKLEAINVSTLGLSGNELCE